MLTLTQISPRRINPGNKPHIYKQNGIWRVAESAMGLESFVFISTRAKRDRLATVWAARLNTMLWDKENYTDRLI